MTSAIASSIQEQTMPEDQEAQDRESIQRLRDLGYSITAFTPDEVGEADSGVLEDLMTERGWDFIEHCNNNQE
jgi:hypothetical protein